MRNLILAMTLVSVVLSSCTVEDSLERLVEPTGNSNYYPEIEHNTYNTNNLPNWSSDAILIHETNWTNDDDRYFLHPIEYNGEVVYSGTEIKSLNPLSGDLSWGIDVDLTTSSVKIGLVEDKIVTIKKDKIYVIDLEQRVVQDVYDWPVANEHLSNSFEIFGGVLYVALQNSHENYSAIASCDLSSLSDAKWTYHFLENSSIKFRGCDDIFRVNQGVSLAGSSAFTINNQSDIFLYFTGTKDGSYGTKYIEKFNLSQNTSEWFYDNAISIDQIEFYEDKILLGTNMSITALDDNGAQIWDNEFAGPRLQYGRGAEFIIVENMLVSLSNYHTSAYDITSGERIWEINLQYSNYRDHTVYNDFQLKAGYTKGSANVYQDKIYYLSSAGQLIIVDLSTGTHVAAALASGDNFSNSHLIVTSQGTVVAGRYGKGPVSFPVPN